MAQSGTQQCEDAYNRFAVRFDTHLLKQTCLCLRVVFYLPWAVYRRRLLWTCVCSPSGSSGRVNLRHSRASSPRQHWGRDWQTGWSCTAVPWSFAQTHPGYDVQVNTVVITIQHCKKRGLHWISSISVQFQNFPDCLRLDFCCEGICRNLSIKKISPQTWLMLILEKWNTDIIC